MNKICLKIACISAVFMLANCFYAHSQTTNAPKREFRAMWIANVSNVDFPSSSGLGAAQQQAEFINFLELAKAANLNAVVVQVRSSCDAMYQSRYEPYSQWLTGTQGRNPGYDPLRFMIAESHKRGIEFHAWFNPYRAVVSNTASIDTSHISIKQPSWILTYNTLKILDPGLPQVREYVTKIVMDVVRRYDIDAVHFDDYFYPYPQAGFALNDEATFQNNSRGISNKDTWRRDNVDLMVKKVADSIKSAKPHVKFGISPFAIWKNNPNNDAAGSATSGLESYFAIYSDSKKWFQNGWVDYLIPQVYWQIGFPAANYAVLTPWWASQNTFGNHLYIGQAPYRIATWGNASEMNTQIQLNRSTNGVLGSCFFSAKNFVQNPFGFVDSLRASVFRYKTLVPTMLWRDQNAPMPVRNLVSQFLGNGQTQLTWQKPLPATDGDTARFYCIYKFFPNTNINLNDATKILDITNQTTFIDPTPTDNGQYVVTALDRYWNESTQATVIGINEISKVADLFKMYPNPAKERLKIEANSRNLAVELRNIQGQLLYSINFSAAGNYQIDLSNIKQGIYFVVAKKDNLVQTEKLVVE